MIMLGGWQVKNEMRDMTTKSAERMQIQMGTVMETLEQKMHES